MIAVSQRRLLLIVQNSSPRHASTSAALTYTTRALDAVLSNFLIFPFRRCKLAVSIRCDIYIACPFESYAMYWPHVLAPCLLLSCAMAIVSFFFFCYPSLLPNLLLVWNEPLHLRCRSKRRQEWCYRPQFPSRNILYRPLITLFECACSQSIRHHCKYICTCSVGVVPVDESTVSPCLNYLWPFMTLSYVQQHYKRECVTSPTGIVCLPSPSDVSFAFAFAFLCWSTMFSPCTTCTYHVKTSSMFVLTVAYHTYDDPFRCRMRDSASPRLRHPLGEHLIDPTRTEQRASFLGPVLIETGAGHTVLTAAAWVATR